MAQTVLYHANGADVDIGTTSLINGIKKLRTAFSKIYGVTANPIVSGEPTPDRPIVIDWYERTGSQWVSFHCGDFHCDITYNIVGRL